MQEIWKDIPSYEGLYQISNYGNVKSIKRDKILKPQVNGRGYLSVGLSKNGKHKTFRLNRLVMITFVGYVEGKDQVNHIDGDKTNNRLDNLEWCTQSENMIHAFANGLYKKKKRRVRKIRCKETGDIYDSGADASRKLGYDKSTILRICHGIKGYESLYGYHFEFVD